MSVRSILAGGCLLAAMMAIGENAAAQVAVTRASSDVAAGQARALTDAEMDGVTAGVLGAFGGLNNIVAANPGHFNRLQGHPNLWIDPSQIPHGQWCGQTCMPTPAPAPLPGFDFDTSTVNRLKAFGLW